MHALRCLAAEWLVVRARLVRTRLGLWLLLLAAALSWAAPPGSHATVAVRAGLIAGVLSVAFAVGARTDRRALRTSLAHPTSPLAVAAGRWLAATVAAGLAVTAVAGAVTLRDGAGPVALLGAWVGGAAAAALAAACALPATLAGGNLCAALLVGAAALADPALIGTPPFLYGVTAGAAGGIPLAALLLTRR